MENVNTKELCRDFVSLHMAGHSDSALEKFTDIMAVKSMRALDDLRPDIAATLIQGVE